MEICINSLISLGNEVLIESLLPVNGLAQFGQLGHWVGQVEQDPRKIRIKLVTSDMEA